MKYYYKQLNENGEIALLLVYDFMPTITDPLVVEITEEEFNAIVAEIRANEPEAEQSEMELKAQAYDILTGVSE